MLLLAGDLAVGTVFDIGSHRLSEREIVDFGRAWDPLPHHTEPGSAPALRFGGVIASGVHVLAVFQRLQVDAFLRRVAVVAGMGTDGMHLLAPSRPGDVLSGRVEIVAVTPRPGRDDAIVRTLGRLSTGTGTVVFEVDARILVRNA
ncbi:MaoC/PaaZ C-terminal domain-containing protein [Pseudonocardia spirodelae]|uniref:MaoC/PaaZ C-terminal domain-containing protein n=1 Tax=Pseudonocardia spirodelae TaxID=3133431 RepID=A0ABU8T688_9PSEU